MKIDAYNHIHLSSVHRLAGGRECTHSTKDCDNFVGGENVYGSVDKSSCMRDVYMYTCTCTFCTCVHVYVLKKCTHTVCITRLKTVEKDKAT